MSLRSRLLGTVCAVVIGLPLALGGSGAAFAESLNDALAQAYRYNPRIDAQRAQLRATDEEVARAMSGYRPVISATGDVNFQHTNTRPATGSEGTAHPKGYSIELVQPVFSGFQTYNAVNEQEANVRAGREALRDVEQTVLLDAVTAYMDVVRDEAIVKLRENNVNVLSRELKATKDRFAVGEVTKTDVAQAEARRAGAVSNLDLARANLKTSRANYQRVIGTPPSGVSDPKGYDRYLPGSLDTAISVGTHEYPGVVIALFQEQAAKFAVDRIRGELLPQFQVEASYTDRYDSASGLDKAETGLVTGRLRVPLYEGGEVYARVRQAKEIHVSRLQSIETARSEAEARVVSAWSQLQAARAQLESDRSQVKANQTALTGVREEERVGQRTLLDVLNQELELLASQVQLVQTERNIVVFSFTLMQAIGKLDVVSLGLTDVAYDPEVHYQETRRRPWGTSITHEDGRIESLAPPPGK